jgi:transcriptional regulator GlxA family with amidase domain
VSGLWNDCDENATCRSPEGRSSTDSKNLLVQKIKASQHDEILKLQLLRVKQLLTETSLPMATIATRTGFRHVEYLSAVFKQRFGMPPSEYRTAHQR